MHRTEWSPIRSVIKRVGRPILVITSVIDYRQNWTARSPVTNFKIITIKRFDEKKEPSVNCFGE